MISGFFSLAAAGIGLSPTTSFWVTFTSFIASGFLLSTFAFLKSHVKWDSGAATLGDRLKTLHLNELWLQFYDTELNANVRYAKHALAIAENRQDFARVPWAPSSIGKAKHEGRDEYGNNRFEQIWLAGNHSDIGGSYPENESRLSDIALKWMVECATFIPDGLVVDDCTLRIYPDTTGVQHDEIKSGFGTLADRFGLNWPAGLRAPVTDATLHKSVYLRFAGKPVVHYDVETLYRPPSLREHVDLSKYYEDPFLRCPPDFIDLIKCLARHPTGKPIEAADPTAPAVGS